MRTDLCSRCLSLRLISLALCCRLPSAKAQKSDSDLDIKQLIEQIVLGELFWFKECLSVVGIHDDLCVQQLARCSKPCWRSDIESLVCTPE